MNLNCVFTSATLHLFLPPRHGKNKGRKRTLISAIHHLVPTTAAAGCRPRSISCRALGARIALASARDRLVDGLGRGLRLPVRVELRVIAFFSNGEVSQTGHWVVWIYILLSLERGVSDRGIGVNWTGVQVAGGGREGEGEGWMAYPGGRRGSANGG